MNCRQKKCNSEPTEAYSLMNFPRFAMELVRNDVSSSMGAALANALLINLTSLFSDPSIVQNITEKWNIYLTVLVNHYVFVYCYLLPK